MNALLARILCAEARRRSAFLAFFSGSMFEPMEITAMFVK